MSPFADKDWLCINTVRTLSIDAIEKAKSGHPGLPLGAAPMAYVLWARHLNVNPRDPKWPNRDRFVLSAGHGSMLLYSLLHLAGFDVPMDAIQAFRQWESLTPGHPEFNLTPGVEATTGPLGQGAANAVGMAIAERRLAQLFNRPEFEAVSHFTYALVSDGDLMEGVAAEAASLAGHLKLGKLIYLYDANDITLDGPTTLTFSTEDVAKRYESYGWQVITVTDGDHDLEGIDRAITQAKNETQKPSLIVVKTTIGFGSPNKQGKSAVHGSPLGKDELALTKQALKWPSTEPFFVPQSVREDFSVIGQRGETAQGAWEKKFQALASKDPSWAKAWQSSLKLELPSDTGSVVMSASSDTAQATRQSGGVVVNAISRKIPWLIGGDADLSCSTNTYLKDQGAFEGQKGSGNNIHYGVREHAMASIANGIAYHGGLLPFVSTFFCFADYMRPAIRLAAMNHLPVVYVWTHDSVALGEDGPTHQPVEHLMSLRCMPNMVLLRPADHFETQGAWLAAIQNRKGPTGIVLTRQKVPVIPRAKDESIDIVLKGAYTVQSKGNPQLALMATGSEVGLALEVQSILDKKGIGSRVVSMPSWELYQSQSAAYRDQVLPPTLRARASIEAGVTWGWERWLGSQGLAVGIDRFGASAPAEVLMKEFGLEPAAIATRCEEYLKQLTNS